MKKKITLYSLDVKEYPNIEIEVEVIEDASKNIAKLSEGKTFQAIKKAVVQAREAKAGEVVDTRPRVEVDGKIYTFSETKRTITEKEEQNCAMIIINPNGEEYVIDTHARFDAKYYQIDKGYIANEGTKSFVRSNGNYVIKRSDGKEQIVLKGSYVCVQDLNRIYGVTNTSFDDTYTTDIDQITLISGAIEAINKARLL